MVCYVRNHEFFHIHSYYSDPGLQFNFNLPTYFPAVPWSSIHTYSHVYRILKTPLHGLLYKYTGFAIFSLF